MLSDLLISVATVSTKTWANVRGVRTPTMTTATYPASVQPMTTARQQAWGMDAGRTGWTVYFAADPAVNVSDTIAWGSHTLSVLGPARDEAGRGVAWAVDCEERS